jgi:hypothetical protein
MLVEQVTLSNLDSFIERCAKARNGELSEGTYSEAMFVFSSPFWGAYILSADAGIRWVSLQNASARWSDGGKPFYSVRAALMSALSSASSDHTTEGGAFYSEDSVARLRWLADQVESFKASSRTNR